MRTACMLTCAVLVAATAGASFQHEGAMRHIDRAGQLLFTGATADVQLGVASLLDAVIELAPQAGAPSPARASLQTARNELASGRQAADERVGALLREAYKGFGTGKPLPQAPADDMDAVLQDLKRRLASARELAAAGNAGESARVLLGVALTIVTPMQQ